MLTIAEKNTISKIADRAVDLLINYGKVKLRNETFAKVATHYDLSIVHLEIVPLRLVDLLNASEFDLIHDVMGIHRHLGLDAKNKPVLTGGFMPRYADVCQ